MQRYTYYKYLYIKSTDFFLRLVFVLAFWTACLGSLSGQQKDSLAQELFHDSITKFAISDTSRTDSLFLQGQQLYLMSADSIAEPVDYNARDSMIFDYVNKWIHLYGDAYIKYQTMTIKADYIRIDMNQSIAYADPLIDSLGQKTGLPHFQDGTQQFDAESMRYQFKTRKGTISKVITKEADIFILGEKTKFIAKTGEVSRQDDIIFNYNGIFTTCDHPEPHFGVYSKKQKVIPNKLVIVGPSIVKIKGIPVPPFMLPFGFFPLSKDRSSGLIIPNNYIFDNSLGFGLQNIGYYQPINDYLDLKLLTDVYLKGSFKLGISGNYNKKYKSNGRFNVEYSRLRRELSDSYKKITQQPIKISWSHNQDPKSHPYRRLNGSIEIQTAAYDRLLYRDVNSQSNNQLRSSMTFNYAFPGSAFSFVAGINHSQNLQTRIVDMTLPSVEIRMRPLSPFKKKNSVSTQQSWYEKITVNYNSSVANRFTTYDSILFSPRTLDTMRYGVKHTASVDASFRILKYFNLTPSMNYNEEWFFNRQNLSLKDTVFLDTLRSRADSIYGLEIKNIERGFFALRTMSANLSLNTQIYGQILSSKGWFRGIRHIISPNVSMSFAPNYDESPFNYWAYVNTDTRPEKDKIKRYLIYDRSPFGTNSVNAENFQINFNVNNRVEGKYYSKKDTIFKKLSIIDNFSFGGSYNVFGDSFNLSQISGGGQTTILKGLSRLSYSVSFDPYQRVLSGNEEVRINRYRIKGDGKLAYLTAARLELATTSSIPNIIKLFSKSGTSTDPLPDLGSFFSTFGLSHTIAYQFRRLASGKDTIEYLTNSLSTNGSIKISPNWSLNVGNIGYDFKNMGLTYPDISLRRTLHCWNLEFKYYPQAGSFAFFIGVNPGPLDFLKIPSNQNFTGSR